MNDQNPVNLANQLIEAVVDSSQAIEEGLDLACHKTSAILFTCSGRELKTQDRLDALLTIHGLVMTLQEANENDRAMWNDIIDVSSYDLPSPNFTYLHKAADAALEAIENEISKKSHEYSR